VTDITLNPSILEVIVVAIFVSTIINIILKRYNFPTIIGYIATGTIIAYSFNLHEAVHNEHLKEIAEFGVVFLMFTIGLEFSIKKMQNMKYEVFVSGTFQVTISTLIFVAISYFMFDIPFKQAIIIGAALALSSTAIVLKILNENGDINKRYGQRVLGILLFQDIAVIPILLIITIFAQPDKDLTTLLTQTVLSAFFLLLLLWGIGRFLLEKFFSLVSYSDSNEMFISAVLLIVLGASSLAHMFGFSYSLGAFIAGMLIAETHYKHQVEADLVPFRDLLLGIFFITVGMQIDFMILKDHFLSVIILFTMIVLIKVFVIYRVIRLKTTRRISVKTALALFQVGEFALAIFELARSKDLFEPQIGQILIATVVISMVLTPFMLKHLSKFVDLTHGDITEKAAWNIDPSYRNHVVVIGYSYFGQKVATLLQERFVKYIIIEHDIQLVKLAQENNEPVVFGNAAQTSILNSVHIREAMSVIVAVDNPSKLHLICSAVDSLTHNSTTVVKVTRESEKESLKELNLSHIIVEGYEMSSLVVSHALSKHSSLLKRSRKDDKGYN
jgi:monovalent cation:H+ antiporter-2, CPA2 family